MYLKFKIFVCVSLCFAGIYLILTTFYTQQLNRNRLPPVTGDGYIQSSSDRVVKLEILNDIVVKYWDEDTESLYKKQLNIEYINYHKVKNCTNHHHPSAESILIQPSHISYGGDDDDDDDDDETSTDNSNRKSTISNGKYPNIITAFHGDNLIDDIWQYISLLAIQLYLRNFKNRNNTQVFLTEPAKNRITSIFDNSSTILSFSTIHPHCYDLTNAIVIGSTDELIPKIINDGDEPNKRKPLIILEKSAVRYEEIIAINGMAFRNQLKLRFNYFDVADRELGLIKMHKNHSITDLDTIFIGLYIDSEFNVPDSYYDRAIDFQRKLHPMAIFVIICTHESIDYCFEYFNGKENENVGDGRRPSSSSAADDIHVKQSNYIEFDLAILSYCNHTIISNTNGLIPALINGGDTVVYDSRKNDREYYLPFLLADGLENWYALA